MPRKITRVTKRDGRTVDYDEHRIADAIHRAARSVGKDNRYLADDLAGVVTLYLDRYYDGDLPASTEIQQMLEKILFETGHADIAKAYILYRENKGRVTEPDPPPTGDLFPESRLMVDGLTRDEVTAWGRERITSALVKEAGLEPSSAEEVAAAVERKIFGLGQSRVSTTQIRDLVNHELLLRGYASKVPRQFIVGLPKYDLARLLEPDSPDADALVRTIGETTLKQYALQEIYSREVADAHLEGRIHIHHLEQPLKLAWLGIVPGDLPRIPGLKESARTLTARIVAGRESMNRRAIGVEMPAFNAAYRGADREEAVHALLSMGDWIPGLDLTRETTFALHYLQAARDQGHRGERLVIVNGPCEALSEACRQAVEGAPTLFAYEQGRSRFGRIPAVIAVATLNLPQTFFRNETDFYSEVEESLELAVRSHLEKRRLLRKMNAEPEEGTYAIGLVGLSDLVRALCGKSPGVDDSALKLGLRIVSYIYFRVKEESAKHRLALSIEDVPTEPALERFFRIDAQLYPRARGLGVEGYAGGFHLHEPDAATRLEVESRFHTLIPGRVELGAEGSSADLEAIVLQSRERSLTAQIHVR